MERCYPSCRPSRGGIVFVYGESSSALNDWLNIIKEIVSFERFQHTFVPLVKTSDLATLSGSFRQHGPVRLGRDADEVKFSAGGGSFELTPRIT